MSNPNIYCTFQTDDVQLLLPHCNPILAKAKCVILSKRIKQHRFWRVSPYIQPCVRPKMSSRISHPRNTKLGSIWCIEAPLFTCHGTPPLGRRGLLWLVGNQSQLVGGIPTPLKHIYGICMEYISTGNLYIYIYICIYWLVVYLPPWKIWKSTGMIIPNIWENKRCSKPPTSQKSWALWHSPGHIERTCSMHQPEGFKWSKSNIFDLTKSSSI